MPPTAVDSGPPAWRQGKDIHLVRVLCAFWGSRRQAETLLPAFHRKMQPGTASQFQKEGRRPEGVFRAFLFPSTTCFLRPSTHPGPSIRDRTQDIETWSLKELCCTDRTGRRDGQQQGSSSGDGRNLGRLPGRDGVAGPLEEKG